MPKNKINLKKNELDTNAWAHHILQSECLEALQMWILFWSPSKPPKESVYECVLLCFRKWLKIKANGKLDWNQWKEQNLTKRKAKMNSSLNCTSKIPNRVKAKCEYIITE